MSEKYICPMHPEVTSDKKGHCPKCGMNLIKESEAHDSNHQMHHSDLDPLKTTWKSYLPLIVIISLILLTSIVIGIKTIGVINNQFIFAVIEYFMIGFFITFAAFKLMDLKGFAEGYFTYDLLAKNWFTYGYMYPFIELFFGLAMILDVYQKQILILEILVMTFSGIGVLIKLLKREKFQCACLGTFLKVPLTKITVIEDFGMALLAAILLFTQY